jgi:translation initiation factor 2 subunit 3
MSAQVTAQSTVSKQETARRIPSQPVVNIGTSGHVDHGKCLALDEYILLNGSLTTGREILETISKRGTLLRTVDGGSVYQLEGNQVVSLNQELKTVKTHSLFYYQPYTGSVHRVTTRTGRSITVTPEHPLLVNRRGSIIWSKAKELRADDYVAFTSYIPSFDASQFPDPIENLRQTNNIVTWEDYQHLRNMTDDFVRFSSLNPKEFDQLRLLAGLSKTQLSKNAGIDRETLNNVLSEHKSFSSTQLSKLILSFEGADFCSLSTNEWVMESRRQGSRYITKLRDGQIDDDLLKWFAFVWSEGSSDSRRIAVAQTVQKKMLEEFLEITDEKFGMKFKQVSDIDYHLNSMAFAEYLKAKFDFRPGNEQVCGISPWVLGLGSELKNIFLRWFFTLDGEFNRKAGQISITQRNERNIVVIAYLLGMFGIVPRFGKKKVTTKKGKITYTRLIISGRHNLRAFAEHIGFENTSIQQKLEAYLSSIKSLSKESNLGIPIDGKLLGHVLKASGIIRESFGLWNTLPLVKKSDWYKGYSTARMSGRISRTKLLLLIDAVENHLRKVEDSLNRLRDAKSLRTHMNLARISFDEVAERVGTSRKALSRILRIFSQEHLGQIRSAIRSLTLEKLKESTIRLLQFKQIANCPLEFDQIKSVEVRDYSGYIFDLTVPEHANFIAGNGAIVCHNTTLTEAITGIWTSAHSEELRRGITIKVGYADAAFYKCEGAPPPDCYVTSPDCEKVGGGKAKLLRVVSFVDCPGHESLMANMLSGAAVMDGSVLVIAANEKVPQPQTREHLLALQMLGMTHIVIAQNKVDLVSDKQASENYEGIRKFVTGSVAEKAPIIPISAQHRLNIDALIEAIEENIPTPKRDENASPLMQVLRSFDVNHPGLSPKDLVGGVLGGTLLQGKLSEGDDIELKPGIVEEGQTRAEPIQTRIVSLMSSAGRAKELHPGGLISVGTQLDPFYTRSDSLVGSIVGKPGQLPPVFESLSMDVQLFETAVGTQELVKVEKIRMSEVLRLNVGTGVTVGIVSSTRESIVDAKLKKPVCTSKGSRAAISRRIGDRWRLIGSGTVR